MPKSRQNCKKRRSNKSKKQRYIQNNRKSVAGVSEVDTLLNGAKKPHSLDYVLKFFQNNKLFSLFSGIKGKGYGLATVFFTLIIIKFLRIETVNGIYTTGFKEVEAGKDVFYDFKNNGHIPWRKILLETVKTYRRVTSQESTNRDNQDVVQGEIKTLHIDDSDLGKRGQKIEGVGTVWSHVENRSIMGYKILVLGFWDGGCFLPIDFSLHREKGRALLNATKLVYKKEKEYDQAKSATIKLKKEVAVYQRAKTTAARQLAVAKNTKARPGGTAGNPGAEETIRDISQLVDTINLRLNRLGHRLDKSVKEFGRKETALQKAQENCSKIERSAIRYGLSKEERAKQFSKKRNNKSAGFKRYVELNSKKNKNAEKMIRRAVYHGFKPDYILADSWFFSYSIITTVRALDKGGIHYLGMAKMGNILYGIGDKKYKASEILSRYKKQAHSCRKIKARYITVAVKYQDIDLNLMFVRLNGTKQWRLLATTDMKLTFIKAIEIYQIRWSIEVFFKDTKQHLGLGKCQSNDFDAQIADNTIVMIRYIILSLHKRIHYKQSIGGLFKELSDNMIEANLAQKLWHQFIELQLYIAEKLNCDFEILYNEIKRDKAANIKFAGVIEIFGWFYREIQESVDVIDVDEDVGLAA